jgi:hypothetical protein
MTDGPAQPALPNGAPDGVAGSAPGHGRWRRHALLSLSSGMAAAHRAARLAAEIQARHAWFTERLQRLWVQPAGADADPRKFSWVLGWHRRSGSGAQARHDTGPLRGSPRDMEDAGGTHDVPAHWTPGAPGAQIDLAQTARPGAGARGFSLDRYGVSWAAGPGVGAGGELPGPGGVRRAMRALGVPSSDPYQVMAAAHPSTARRVPAAASAPTAPDASAAPGGSATPGASAESGGSAAPDPSSEAGGTAASAAPAGGASAAPDVPGASDASAARSVSVAPGELALPGAPAGLYESAPPDASPPPGPSTGPDASAPQRALAAPGTSTAANASVESRALAAPGATPSTQGSAAQDALSATGPSAAPETWVPQGQPALPHASAVSHAPAPQAASTPGHAASVPFAARAPSVPAAAFGHAVFSAPSMGWAGSVPALNATSSFTAESASQLPLLRHPEARVPSGGVISPAKADPELRWTRTPPLPGHNTPFSRGWAGGEAGGTDVPLPRARPTAATAPTFFPPTRLFGASLPGALTAGHTDGSAIAARRNLASRAGAHEGGGANARFVVPATAPASPSVRYAMLWDADVGAIPASGRRAAAPDAASAIGPMPAAPTQRIAAGPAGPPGEAPDVPGNSQALEHAAELTAEDIGSGLAQAGPSEMSTTAEPAALRASSTPLARGSPRPDSGAGGAHTDVPAYAAPEIARMHTAMHTASDSPAPAAWDRAAARASEVGRAPGGPVAAQVAVASAASATVQPVAARAGHTGIPARHMQAQAWRPDEQRPGPLSLSVFQHNPYSPPAPTRAPAAWQSDTGANAHPLPQPVDSDSDSDSDGGSHWPGPVPSVPEHWTESTGMSLAEPARGRQPGSPPHPLPVVHRLRAAREVDSTAPHASAAGAGIDQAVPGEVVPVARETAAARPDPAAAKADSADSQPDLEQLTEQVWRSILDRLLIEQERRGGSTWLA